MFDTPCEATFETEGEAPPLPSPDEVDQGTLDNDRDSEPGVPLHMKKVLLCFLNLFLPSFFLLLFFYFFFLFSFFVFFSLALRRKPRIRRT